MRTEGSADHPEGDILGVFDSAIRDAAQDSFGRTVSPSSNDNGSALLFMGLADNAVRCFQIRHLGQDDDIALGDAGLDQKLGRAVEDVIYHLLSRCRTTLSPRSDNRIQGLPHSSFPENDDSGREKW